VHNLKKITKTIVPNVSCHIAANTVLVPSQGIKPGVLEFGYIAEVYQLKKAINHAPAHAPNICAKIIKTPNVTCIFFESLLTMKAKVTAGLSCALLIFQQNMVKIHNPINKRPVYPVTNSIVRTPVAKNSSSSFDEENLTISPKDI